MKQQLFAITTLGMCNNLQDFQILNLHKIIMPPDFL